MKKLDKLVLAAFASTALKTKFEQMDGENRARYLAHLEKTIPVSQAHTTEYGTATIKQKALYEVDREEVSKAVYDGRISIVTLVNAFVGNSSAGKLMEIGGEKAVRPNGHSQYLELRPYGKFKEQFEYVEMEFNEFLDYQLGKK